MVKTGFTGTRIGMTRKQKAQFEYLLKKIGVTELHIGDCVGADVDAFNIAKKVGGIELVGHPPSDAKLRAWLKYDRFELEKPFLERNHDIVDATVVLIATPKTLVEYSRSGTWATVRYARKKKRDIRIIYPY